MSFEKRWDAIAPRALLNDGTAQGLITIADAIDLHVKQIIFLKGTALPSKKVQINAVISQTEIIVGEPGSKIDEFTDVSAYSTALGSTISSEIQPRPSIPDKEYERASFEEEPVVAKRVIQVDAYGNKYTKKNPVPVQLSDGDVNIGTVEANIEVHTTHLDNSPETGRVHDSMRIGDGNTEVTNAKADDDSRVGLGVISFAKPFTKPYTGIRVTSKNDDGDPLIAISSNPSGDVQMVTIVYDSDGDFLNFVTTDAP